MVFLWAWRLYGWRWLQHKHQNMPKFYSVITLGGLVIGIIKSAHPNLHELEGFTHGYRARLSESGNQILDDKKIVTLAARRKKMLQDKQEAQEYFAKNGYKPRATNQYIILNDSLGY